VVRKATLLSNSKLKSMSDINKFKPLEIWFVTGSQHLYGPEALKKVDEHSKAVVKEP
jgi:hypothetical protein